MKVWIVEEVMGNIYDIPGVFSTSAKAVEFLLKLAKNQVKKTGCSLKYAMNSFQIEDFDVDEHYDTKNP